MSLLDFLKKEEDTRVSILIAEDSPTQAMQLQFILEENNFRVTVAKDGKEALAAIKKQKPVLLISDIQMPNMDGYELCLAVKSDDALKDMPVILMTSLSDPKEVVKGLYCGADNLIAKPYSEQFLLSRINNMLTNIEMRKSSIGDEYDGEAKGIFIRIGGQKHFMTAERLQSIDLLLSSYEIAMQKNHELSEAKATIEKQAEELKDLRKKLGMPAS